MRKRGEIDETMFNNRMTDINIQKGDNEDDFYNSGTRQRLSFTWSSPEDNRYIVKQRFVSPRVLSKSVPRRNKNFVHYKINRSLNFDIGGSKNEGLFTSPNSSSESGSYEEEKQLTRSTKIMKALSNNYSPLHTEKRKIKKSLNFDTTPSPKGFGSLAKSPHGILNIFLNTPSHRINKTLNFDTSPSESDASSVLVTSVESIDENQNQTPSRQDRKAKKSLNYLSPNVNRNMSSPKFSVASPMLRSGLKKKIDNIVQISTMPKVYSIQQNREEYAIERERNANTSRNLFNDFNDEEDERPQTPENMIRIIPESMSAIKKSHKKERLSRRSQHGAPQETELFPEEENSKDSFCSEQRPLTPPLDEKYPSPTYDVNSIKRSHKKDKSKKPTPQVHSEEELSDTGSIFDYSEIRENVSIEDDDPKALGDSPKNANNDSLIRKNNYNAARNKNESFSSVKHVEQLRKNIDSLEDNELTTPKKLVLSDSLEDLCGHKSGENNESLKKDADNNNDEPEKIENANEPQTPPNVRIIPCDSDNPVVPCNRINFLQRIATESIKKSHKKVKDDNRKKFFKPRSLQDDINVSINASSKIKDEQVKVEETESAKDETLENLVESQSDDRAGTPENVNSSRLLLSQFSSVKKSHKKDKHVKVATRYARIHKYLKASGDNAVGTQTECQSLKPLASEDNLDCKENKPELLALGSSNQSENESPSFNKPSPNKRKSSSDDSFHSVVADELEKSKSMEYESTEDDFQIHTPIKKRRSLKQIALVDRSVDDEKLEGNGCEDVSRCLTPVSHHCDPKDGSVTPLKSASPEMNRREEVPAGGDQANISENSNGRSTTPKNMSTAELLANVTSIKKSHKKDKRGSILQRGLAYEKKKMRPNDGQNQRDSPRPSTSQQSSNQPTVQTQRVDQQISPCKTPPNCLKAKSYMRLLQTTSIKKSHKKVRDKKKAVVAKSQDQELSDDGSIFGDEDKINGAPADGDVNANTQGSGTNDSSVNIQQICLNKKT